MTGVRSERKTELARETEGPSVLPRIHVLSPCLLKYPLLWAPIELGSLESREAPRSGSNRAYASGVGATPWIPSLLVCRLFVWARRGDWSLEYHTCGANGGLFESEEE